MYSLPLVIDMNYDNIYKLICQRRKEPRELNYAENHNFKNNSYVEGKLCFNDGIKNKYFYPDEIIPTGYVKGMAHIRELQRVNKVTMDKPNDNKKYNRRM